MIVLFTDFGFAGPYLGQVANVLAREAPDARVINLFADAPAQDPHAAAYLLPAYIHEFPTGTVFLCVVDPGVGSDRAAVVVSAGGRWYVGPDNGLFEHVMRRCAGEVRSWHMAWQPHDLSATFHGRDLFAPVAAELAYIEPESDLATDLAESGPALRFPDWPDDLAEVIYVDGFGNAMTGLRASALPADAALACAGRTLVRRRTFSDVAAGESFCYENANGLLEIAVNKGRADEMLGLRVRDRVEIIKQN
ncbi:MAG: SAM-dependent chlorinase/fluorinase [Hyphomicrobiales bacterium]|nr:SAM-dependent chlorinase/fluorinase [Hyphomicrobiales bacterium]